MSFETTQIASHNGDPILIADVLNIMKASGDIGAIENAVSQVAAKRYASENGINASVSELQAAADTFRQEAGLQRADDMHQWLEGTGQSLDAFEARLELNIVEQKLRQHVVTQAEVERRFLAERNQLEQVELAEIVLSSEGQAAELMEQILEGEQSFEGAVSLSIDPGASRQNGYAGWHAISELPGEVQSRVRATAVGDVTGPVKTDVGFVILKIWNKSEPKLDDALYDALAQMIYKDWLAKRLSETAFDFERG